MKLLLFIITLLVWSQIIGQKEEEKYLSIEKHILIGELDMAVVQLNVLNDQSTYSKTLNNLIKEEYDYADLLTFTDKLLGNYRIGKGQLQYFLEKNLKTPEKTDVLNSVFVKVKWMQMIHLLEEVSLTEAEVEFQKLSNYISKFDKTKHATKRAIFYKNTYSSVLETIKQDFDKLKEICDDNMSIAMELQDTTLMIISDSYYSGYLMAKQDLEGYIALAEKNIALGKLLKERTSHSRLHAFNLINALIFQQGNNAKVLNILDEFFYKPDSRYWTYSYFLQLVLSEEVNNPIAQTIFNKFGTNDVLSFCDSLYVQGQGKTVPNEFNALIDLATQVLSKYGLYKESLEYANKSVRLNKEIYSTELANTMAINEIRKVEEDKNHELEFEKQKTKKNSYIAVLLGLVSLISFMSIYLQINKAKKLTAQRNQIEKKDKEKEILLKEIHHRVKNNFQIVSSLLQLQSKNIKDETAKAITLEGQNRVASMALIHQKLYQNNDFDIEFKDYVTELVTNINELYGVTKILVDLSIDENITFDIDTAIPLGLILNELITNAFKYAFSDDSQKNELIIRIEKGDEIHTLTVLDNGPGIDSSKTLEQNKSIGMKLIKSLTKQLHGQFEYEFKNGAQFKIYFKETFQRELVD